MVISYLSPQFELCLCNCRLASKNRTVGLTDYQQTVGWEIVNTKSRYCKYLSLFLNSLVCVSVIRLESVVYPLFTEPTHMVVFDIAFKRETYFDGSFGVLVKVKRKQISTKIFLNVSILGK